MPKAPKMIGTTMAVGSVVEFSNTTTSDTFTVRYMSRDAALIEDASGQLGLVHPSWLTLIAPWRSA